MLQAAAARRYFEGTGTSAVSSDSSIWPDLSGSRVGAGDGDVIGVRQPQRITVAFTPRQFPTPARESNAPLEEEVSTYMYKRAIKNALFFMASDF